MEMHRNSLTSKGLTGRSASPAYRPAIRGAFPAICQKLSWLVFYFPLAFICLSSCSSDAIIDEAYTIPGGVWKQEDRVRFEVPVQDTAVTYRFFLNIRNSVDYGYSNVYFFIMTRFPDGRLGRDTVECILADREGKWLGKGISNLRDNQVLLRRGLRFPARGTYIFEIEQAMREKELEGIEDIGIRLEKEFRKIN